eukprot:Polyplicarium_translucidae@DN4126_c0_g1_i1.p2
MKQTPYRSLQSQLPACLAERSASSCRGEASKMKDAASWLRAPGCPWKSKCVGRWQLAVSATVPGGGDGGTGEAASVWSGTDVRGCRKTVDRRCERFAERALETSTSTVPMEMMGCVRACLGVKTHAEMRREKPSHSQGRISETTTALVDLLADCANIKVDMAVFDMHDTPLG